MQVFIVVGLHNYVAGADGTCVTGEDTSLRYVLSAFTQEVVGVKSLKTACPKLQD